VGEKRRIREGVEGFEGTDLLALARVCEADRGRKFAWVATRVQRAVEVSDWDSEWGGGPRSW